MKILVFPKDANRYQELLYEPMRRHGHDVDYLNLGTPSALVNLLLLLPAALVYRLRGYRIFHLHWVYKFTIAGRVGRGRLARGAMFVYFKLFVGWLKLLRFRLVWTAHNLLPHEPVFNDDMAGRKFLARHSDLVVCHSQAAADQVTKMLNVPTAKVVIMPQGNYRELLGDLPDRRTARQRLGWPSADFCFLYIGLIRPYKGVVELVRAYNRLPSANHRLYIVGQAEDDRLAGDIAEASAKNPAVTFVNQFVSDADLSVYLAAASAVVLPFTKVTTSSSALLALSASRLVIVPSLGDLALLPDNVKISYSADDPKGLEKALAKAVRKQNDIRGREATTTKYVDSLSWPDSADKLLKAYSALL